MYCEEFTCTGLGTRNVRLEDLVRETYVCRTVGGEIVRIFIILVVSGTFKGRIPPPHPHYRDHPKRVSTKIGAQAVSILSPLCYYNTRTFILISFVVGSYSSIPLEIFMHIPEYSSIPYYIKV